MRDAHVLDILWNYLLFFKLINQLINRVYLERLIHHKKYSFVLDKWSFFLKGTHCSTLSTFKLKISSPDLSFQPQSWWSNHCHYLLPGGTWQPGLPSFPESHCCCSLQLHDPNKHRNLKKFLRNMYILIKWN